MTAAADGDHIGIRTPNQPTAKAFQLASVKRCGIFFFFDTVFTFLIMFAYADIKLRPHFLNTASRGDA